jgi:Domain of unknown function (DUF1905)
VFLMSSIGSCVLYHAVMQSMNFVFSAAIWLYSGKGAWHFVTLPQDAAGEIRFFNTSAKGFMPIPVSACIGETTWTTSIFPDSKSGSYLLAIKEGVRKAEKLAAGDEVTVQLRVRSG